MDCACFYPSPLGPLLLTAEDRGLTGIWFPGSKYCPPWQEISPEAPVLQQTRRWLDAYFAGKPAEAAPELCLRGTPFQRAVWALLLDIPWGAAETYGGLARRLEAQGGKRVSAQAVGQAVGRNPVSVLIPCHRVVGKDGSLTGYAGGLDKKEALLRLEREGRLFG